MGKIDLYTYSNSITTCYYILGQYGTDKKARSLIVDLQQEVSIIPISEEILTKAFTSAFTDAEDAVQHYSALTVETISCIATRNIKDYKLSKLPVYSSEEFVLKH